MPEVPVFFDSIILRFESYPWDAFTCLSVHPFSQSGACDLSQLDPTLLGADGQPVLEHSCQELGHGVTVPGGLLEQDARSGSLTSPVRPVAATATTSSR